ncbi:MAG: ribonuclease P protein component [Eubacterium sp.]|nr:ribonuclease P protein component [Eubacterium sp.]
MFEKLGKNPEFQKVYKTGKSKANKYLVMYVVTGESGPNRYGFSVSKKVGNSVVRHHITRLLRESVRKNDALVKEGNRIIIIARPGVKEKKFEDVDGAVIHLLGLHRLLK